MVHRLHSTPGNNDCWYLEVTNDLCMQQMPVHDDAIVRIDYTDATLPASVREFRPTVFKEHDNFCCILGPSREAGIFGCGKSLTEAVHSWALRFEERIAHGAPGDEVVQYIVDTRAISKRDVW